MFRLVKANNETLETFSHVSPSLPPAHPPLPSAALLSPPADTENVRDTLHAVCTEQNEQDRAHDMADLHRLMLTALRLAAKNDIAMIEVLQIARSEMPDAIKTLERALEHLCEDEQVDAEESTTALPSREEAGNDNGPALEPRNTGASHCSADTLDRKFIVTGIDALRRLSKGADLGLPSWTITQFEVELGEKVGFGSFSEVFRGTWHKHTVAVKVLDKTTPRKIFLKEVKIWKSLHHPNVLELSGASSASGEPPWFLVRNGLSFPIYLCFSEVGFV
jgi:abelson tyrosine-protein kinase 1